MQSETLPVAAGAVVLPAQIETLQAYGDTIILHLTAKETGGQCTLFTDITPPGGGPPPHYHANEDEIFHVLEGRASFYYESKWTEVPAGTSVFMRKGTVHGFKNVGTAPLRQLIQTIPAGFEDFMRASAREFARAGGPDMERVMQIGAEHGIHFVAG